MVLLEDILKVIGLGDCRITVRLAQDHYIRVLLEGFNTFPAIKWLAHMDPETLTLPVWKISASRRGVITVYVYPKENHDSKRINGQSNTK